MSAATEVDAKHSAPSKSGEELVVVTLNELCHAWTMHNFPAGQDRPPCVESGEQMAKRYALTDEYITKTKPNVVLLQEVGIERLKSIQQHASNYIVLLAQNLKEKDGTVRVSQGGCAILLRKDDGWKTGSLHMSAFQFKAQKPGDNMLRRAILVSATRNGRKFVFGSCHLEGKPDLGSLRISQITEFANAARSMEPGALVILGGDLNEDLADLEPLCKAMGQLGFHRLENKEVTFPQKDHVLDHLFVSSDKAASTAVVQVHPAGRTKSLPIPPYQWQGWGSDHLAVSARLKFE